MRWTLCASSDGTGHVVNILQMIILDFGFFCRYQVGCRFSSGHGPPVDVRSLLPCERSEPEPAAGAAGGPPPEAEIFWGFDSFYCKFCTIAERFCVAGPNVPSTRASALGLLPVIALAPSALQMATRDKSI